ncbi:DUF922 domain-containing protein, partial [Vibrio vulnificus]
YRNCGFLALVLFSHVALGQSLLGYQLDIKYKPYIVTGNNSDELNASFDNDKPKFMIENHADGYTQWKYDIINDDETCELKKFDVEITYILPQLEMSDRNNEAVSEFKPYVEKLYRHEETHCAIAVHLFHEIYLAIKKGQSHD